MAGIRGPQLNPQTITIDKLESATGVLLATTTGIDLTATGQTVIYTVPSISEKVFILGVVLEIESAETVSAVPEVSIGIDPTVDNVFSTEALTAFSVDNSLFTFWNNLNTSQVLAPNDGLILDVSVAATATTLSVSAKVFGILLGSTSVERNIALMTAGIAGMAPTINTTESTIAFNTVLYGNASLFDSGTGSIVIPSAYNGRYAYLSWNAVTTGLSAPSNSIFGYLAVNNDFTINNGIAHGRSGGGGVSGHAGPIQVFTGDAFTLRLRFDSGSSTIDVSGDVRPVNISIMIGGA